MHDRCVRAVVIRQASAGAAQRMTSMSQNAPRLALGLLGFGAFGRLAARHLRPHATLVVHDPAVTTWDMAAHGVRPGTVADVARADVVVLAVPVGALATAIRSLRPHLRPGAAVVDVGSVKVEPAAVMRAELPPFVDIVGTHPLFGPESAHAGLRGHKIALCPIRGRSTARVAAFLRAKLGLRVLLTTPEDHDREAAVVQGLTHLIAKVLTRMEPLPTRLTTRSFEHLMSATAMVRHDAPGVFEAIERANPFAADVRERFLALAEATRAELDPRSSPVPTTARARPSTTGRAETGGQRPVRHGTDPNR